ncbi:MAG TPA: hypothetical protein VMW80_09225 [Candidatus Dormibacteraeota bacterium]|nr:hypothetical protein [Candidatus Dormibacteraeota bacterium]
MDSEAPVFAPRPMTLSELLDAVYRLYRRNFWLFAGVAAVVQVPYQLFLSFVQGQAHSLSQVFSRLQTNPGTTAHVQVLFQTYWQANALVVLVLILFGLLALPLGLAAVTSAGADRYLDRQSSIGLAFQVARRRWLPVLGVFLLMAAIFLAGALTLATVGTILILALKGFGAVLLTLLAIAAVVAGLVAYFRVIVAIPVVVLEPMGPLQALQRSWGLSRRHTWLAFGVVVVLGLIVAILAFLLGLGAGLLALALGGAGSLPGHLLIAAFTVVINVCATPVSALGALLLYFNLRGRQGGPAVAPMQGQPAFQP